MRLLLDTHAYLWWLADDPRLLPAEREAIADPDSIVHVSAVSIWEISIKEALGRLEAGGDLVAEIEANSMVELPVSARHAAAVGRLPRHHDDPFDRMLIAQAQTDDLALVTHDRAFARYEVERLPV